MVGPPDARSKKCGEDQLGRLAHGSTPARRVATTGGSAAPTPGVDGYPVRFRGNRQNGRVEIDHRAGVRRDDDDPVADSETDSSVCRDDRVLLTETRHAQIRVTEHDPVATQSSHLEVGRQGF